MIIKAFVFVAAEHSGGRNDRTSVQRPPPPPCGRQCGTEEGRQAAGPLPAGSTPALCQSASGGKNDQIKLPATGRWRTKRKLRVDAKQTQQQPERRRGELQAV
jgi:hypothetical protein